MFILPGLTAIPEIVFSFPVISNPETDMLLSLIDIPWDSFEASIIAPGLPSKFIEVSIDIDSV